MDFNDFIAQFSADMNNSKRQDPDLGFAEPSASARQAAAAVRDLYNALTQTGFDHESSIYLIGEAIKGTSK